MSMDIELDSAGKHYGYIRIHHSTDESANGWIEVPVISIRGGNGPVILCVGGNHGDEFEGQIIWTRLARQLAPADVHGQLIILPALNLPAAVAGRRVSPLDGLNLNRVFPGAANGSPTQRIAHIVETELLPKCDFVIDLHSGGQSLHYLPGPSVGQADESSLELLRIFGGPIGYVFEESAGGGGGMLGACRRAGIGRLGSEIGGLGSVSPRAVKLGEAGTLRVLAHLGAIKPELTEGLPAKENTRILRRGPVRSNHYMYAPTAGLFEPFLEIGDEVRKGQIVGELITPERPSSEPLPIHAQLDGIVICRRGPGRTQQGDSLHVIGVDL
ncbi:succinylglutamate desuccinylase/aspartoacylase family protein [Burkholderia cepacia]|uniref:succinylglutamate desuccinylase/aspartoacylase family protein n=1 Tax=Burkholderia cepacia TaxID=292 RepID=UPI002AB74118|nr:succinylglutamate desuccinylase/aspartoacylase family protein [Burkholderia cepacia]